MSKNISRRTFIKGAAVSAAGIAAASVLSSCTKEEEIEKTEGELPWLGEEPQISESDIAQELSADVIVVGAGLAGVCATRSAAEEGASVIVIEKADSPQSRSGEFAVINGTLQQAWGRATMNPEAIADRFMRECTYRIKRPIISRWANNNSEVFDWFIAAKEDLYVCETTRSEVPDESAASFLIPLFHPLPAAYDYTVEQFPTFPTSVEFKPSQGPVVAANMEKAINEGDVTPFYGHFVEKLITENGKVIGVLARNAESGKYLRATASKGVILATGDNGSNTEIVDYYCPEVSENGVVSMWMNMDVEGNPTNTGDGLKLGHWAGAKIQQSHAPMIHHMGGAMGITPFLFLNIHGQRFMNEDVPGQQLENQIELIPQRTAYQIFDDGWKDQIEYMPAGHGMVCYYDESRPKNNETYRSHKSQSDVDEAVASGSLFKADTVEELLDQLDIDKENALASIARYNEFARNGVDEDFNKVARRMFALEKPPYYAATFSTSAMLVCLGGLESDEECRTYDEDRNIISGLYVAGNIQGNRYAVEYPICVKGISHSMCMYYGYVAGKNCVNGV